jgi:serine/threonine-protein kinase
MALEPGARLGPYEITGWLGAGGMGEVYRARDPKLGREIAIKTLPAALANDKHRLARFEREAQLLAALNHPHIAAVHSLAEHEGTLYLAMELVEGTTLEHALRSGALPVDEALRLALQLAEALEAAHSKGVVHRDLKPANVMLTPDGNVKVLDFGLAKALASDTAVAPPAQSPASLAMTQQGLVLGTAGYMSPEQASGQAADHRADVWAFGVVLYEMLAGLPPFGGESVPHILADVLRGEPDWSRLPKNLHPRLKLLLERCLTKKPRNRLHSIADARIELEAVMADPAGVSAVQDPMSLRRRANTTLIAFAVIATAVVAAAAGWLVRPLPAPAAAPVARFSISLPVGHQIQPSSMIAVSRDGTKIAYVAEGQLFLRNLGEAEARPVPGTQEAVAVTEPTFSPDGQWLAYVHVVAGPGGPFAVKRIPVNGGAPVSIHVEPTPAGFPRGLTWPTAEALMFANDAGVVRLPANGGAVEVLAASAAGEALLSPQLLPNGKSVLFTRVARGAGGGAALSGFDAAEIFTQSIGAAERRLLWRGGSAARYLPSGHLVFAQGDALFAIAASADASAVRGSPVPLIQGLARSSNGLSDAANFAVSDTGTLVLMPRDQVPSSRFPGVNGPRIETTLVWVDRSGRGEPLPVRPDDYTMVRISPDGTKVALVIGAGLGRATRPTIWLFDLRTENLSLLATEPAIHDGPVWSPDGSRLYFRTYVLSEQGQIVAGTVHSIDLATGEITLIGQSAADFPITMPWVLTPDGETLAVINARGLDDLNIAMLSLRSNEFADLLVGAGNQSEPTFSPNGAWLASSDEPTNGAAEINLRPFPAVGRTRIPVARGRQPVFARAGTELFFFDGRGIAVAPISYDPTLRVGAPRRLFESGEYLYGEFGRAWDPDANGQRFLMIRNPTMPTAPTDAAATPEVDDADRPRIDVVLNWFEELEARVPTGDGK